MSNSTAQTTAEEKFADDVLSCIEDLNAFLPALALKYKELVVVAALAEHVGGALRIFMSRGICGPAQAQRVLEHVSETAFGKNNDLEAARSKN